MTDTKTLLPIDMEFASNFGSTCDPVEGTVVHLDPYSPSVFAKVDRESRIQFSGWDMFLRHHCEPYLAYMKITSSDDNEYDNWQSAYAIRPIKKGDILTVDYNCYVYDRLFPRYETTSYANKLNNDDYNCRCGSASLCVSTTKGFKYLSYEQQQKRKYMSWKHETTQNYNNDDGKQVEASLDYTPGEALSPNVRECWRKDATTTAAGDQAPTLPLSYSDDDSSTSSGE